MKIITILVLSFLFHYTPQDPLDLTGTWIISAESPRGKRTSTLLIEEENENLIGKVEKDVFPILVANNQISFERNLSTPMGSMKVKYNGILDGETMQGESEILSGPMAGRIMQWTGTKK